ncbi:MAG: tRNA uridine-5-carboxymethylaminomethyl(34) synthesis GTPase MnmE [Eubacteriaceae bacterium]|nr:tRNA uridine-5-carboxymethylaminomethyl(34) synthesis GTPase MnmE [Eubacteriaceae bacterium]
MSETTTIAAISTPSGLGGISIIRVSGPDAFDAVGRIFVRPGGKSLSDAPNFSLSYGHIVDDSGAILDEVLVSKMCAPHTYTTEDVAEINCHGGMAASRSVLDELLKDGRIRPAEAGEFTKRAFLGGRIDLSQAEAVSDIITSSSESFSRIAASQVSGNLREHIDRVKDTILNLLSDLEVTIQYPEYDIDELKDFSLKKELGTIRDQLTQLSGSYRRGEIYRSGLRTAIVGRPNVGKSMLLNALLKEDKAIVTDIPGTTRDVVDELIVLDGIPVRIMDTAGIRQSSDTVESIGIERSIAAMERADLVIFVCDGSSPPDEGDFSIWEKASGRNRICVLNKSDRQICCECRDAFPAGDRIELSALTGEGLDELEKRMISFVRSEGEDISRSIILVNSRHKSLIDSALRHIGEAVSTLEEGLPADLIAIDILDAWHELGEITGENTDEDIVDRIFEKFCLGK